MGVLPGADVRVEAAKGQLADLGQRPLAATGQRAVEEAGELELGPGPMGEPVTGGHRRIERG